MWLIWSSTIEIQDKKGPECLLWGRVSSSEDWLRWYIPSGIIRGHNVGWCHPNDKDGGGTFGWLTYGRPLEVRWATVPLQQSASLSMSTQWGVTLFYAVLYHSWDFWLQWRWWQVGQGTPHPHMCHPEHCNALDTLLQYCNAGYFGGRYSQGTPAHTCQICVIPHPQFAESLIQQ